VDQEEGRRGIYCERKKGARERQALCSEGGSGGKEDSRDENRSETERRNWWDPAGEA